MADESVKDELPQERKATDRLPNGRFGPNNRANPGGQPKWVKEVRDLLKEVAPEGAHLLRRVIRGEEPGTEVKDKIKASEVVLKFTIPPPKHEIKLETGSALAALSPEALVAFVTGKKVDE